MDRKATLMTPRAKAEDVALPKDPFAEMSSTQIEVYARTLLAENRRLKEALAVQPASRPAAPPVLDGEVTIEEIGTVIVGQQWKPAAESLLAAFHVTRKSTPPAASQVEALRLTDDYLDQMQAHVDEGGQLSHRNGVELLSALRGCSDDLRTHWVTSYGCDPEPKHTDRTRFHCWCGWSSAPCATVGDALGEYVQHFIAALRGRP